MIKRHVEFSREQTVLLTFTTFPLQNNKTHQCVIDPTKKGSSRVINHLQRQYLFEMQH